MALVWEALVGIWSRPTVVGVLSEFLLFCAPIWAAVLVGLVVGWVWKPKWAAGLVGGEKGESREVRLSRSVADVALGLPSFETIKAQLPACIVSFMPESSSEKKDFGPAEGEVEVGGARSAVTVADLEHLSKLVEETDGGPTWIQMMDRSLPTMSYQAWRRDPETGPPQYRSRTVFEDATPEIVRDLFWDDNFRIKSKWDDMLLYHKILDECSTTGTMIVHWIRKFPFFCSDREYTIGRRIWKSDGSYYCITKGVPYPSLPRQNKPRRVDLYFSSWCIRPAESRRDGRLTACEVILFHHEDMGIPWEIAKLGVRQGMWGTVKKIEPGLRAYQKSREAGDELSHCAILAGVNSKISPDRLKQFETSNSSTQAVEIEEPQKDKPLGKSIPRFIVVGGAIALACSLDRGLLTKALIFGVARKFAKMGR